MKKSLIYNKKKKPIASYFFLAIFFPILTLTACRPNSNKTEITTGIYKTEDGGETWTNLMQTNSELPAQDVSSLTADPTVPNVLYYGDISTGLYKSWNRGESWQNISQGFPAQIQANVDIITFDPQNTNTIYISGLFDQARRIIHGDGGGQNWNKEYAELEKGENIENLQVHPTNSNTLYAISSSRSFLESQDQGLTWRAIHWFKNPAQTLAINFNNPTNIYVGNKDGLFKSTDGGYTWQNLWEEIETEDPKTSLTRKKVHIIKINPFNSNVVVAGTDDGLFATRDNGNSWQSISYVFPVDRPEIEVLTWHPTNPNGLLLGIDDTLYQTDNFGQSWYAQKLNIREKIKHIVVDSLDTNIIYLGVALR